VDSTTQITVTSPPHDAGTVDILVTNADGTSLPVLAGQFLYVPAVPTVTNPSGRQGPAGGGPQGLVTGAEFRGGCAGSCGGAAECCMPGTATQFTALSPAHVPGQIHVLVANADGTSAPTPMDLFTYLGAGPPPRTTTRRRLMGSKGLSLKGGGPTCQMRRRVA